MSVREFLTRCGARSACVRIRFKGIEKIQSLRYELSTEGGEGSEAHQEVLRVLGNGPIGQFVTHQAGPQVVITARASSLLLLLDRPEIQEVQDFGFTGSPTGLVGRFEWDDPSVERVARYFDGTCWREIPVLLRPEAPMVVSRSGDCIGLLPISEYWSIEMRRLQEEHPVLAGKTVVIRA